jgi:hypothetical protein
VAVVRSDSGYVNSSRTFLAVLNFELNVLAFSQSFEAITLDCREVYEHVFAAVSWGNETKTFRLVEPLNLTFNLCHLQNSLECFHSPQALTEVNALSVRMELQADCFAGVWGHSMQQQGVLEAGDLEEALNAAEAIGDDRLQQQSQGRVVPDSFTHGSSEQRYKWFKRGFDSGDPAQCNTFGRAM